MKNNHEETRVFNAETLKQANIHLVVETVAKALKERGYDPVTQLAGYLITNDPAYISSYKNARTLIQTVERDEILKEIVRSYIGNSLENND